MAWVALDRGTRLAPRFGDLREARRWRRRAQELRREILERGFNDEVGSFTSVYGGREVDASLLLLPTYGLLPCSDPRVAKTMERIRKELSEGSFLCRYRHHDGIDAEEGAFVLCGFWLAEALALSGQLDEALEVFGQHLKAANHLGLLAEEVSPADATALGNFPQAFSHLGLIQAAVRLHATLRLRDEGLPSVQPGVPFDPPELL
jgi:GH15 family glucan-1,4-alpha-glucosidase